MSADLDRLLRAMAAQEEPIPKGFAVANDYAERWGKSLQHTAALLRRAAEKKLAERRQVLRRCGNKTMKIWVYRLT
jgi:hypothetical protein